MEPIISFRRCTMKGTQKVEKKKKEEEGDLILSLTEMEDGTYMIDVKDPASWPPVSLLHEEHLDAHTASQMLLDINDALRSLGLEVMRTKIWR